jgi:S1-C subfamily serine protease
MTLAATLQSSDNRFAFVYLEIFGRPDGGRLQTLHFCYSDPMSTPIRLLQSVLFACAAVVLACGWPARAALKDTIAAVKPSVVGVGTLLRTRSPPIVFIATGFAVGDGLSIITNAHALPELDTEHLETLGIVTGRGDQVDFRPVTVAGIDREHDLAHLRLAGKPLPALTLANDSDAAEGQSLAFTGFPLGMALGLTPVTHRAMVSALTPMLLPSLSARRLDARAITQLQKKPFQIMQLDGTSYPGNSGSPVYDADSGAVYGVLNMTFLKAQKESALSQPSGISYAIPARYVRELLQQSATGK